MSSARACLVTGYVRLDLPNRSHAEYERLGDRLLEAADAVDHHVYGGTVDGCWHWRLSEGAILPRGNPAKDTRAFHAVQHQKTAWVAAAADRTDAEILVWLDYGLLHVPGVTEAAVAAFLDRAATDAPRDRVGMASIWGAPAGPVWPVPSPAWFCAGGVFTVPRPLAREWHEKVVAAAVALRERGWATWEVNDWAAAWLANPHLVRPWFCDHDATLLEAGP